MWPKVMFIGSNIVTLTIRHIFHTKNCDYGIWPLKVIQGQIGRCQSTARGSYIQVLHGDQAHICRHFRDISNQMILMLTFNPPVSSKIKFDGANQKPVGTFLYNLCWVQHHISHRLATNHQPTNPPTTQPTRHNNNMCRNRSSMQYLQPGPKNWITISKTRPIHYTKKTKSNGLGSFHDIWPEKEMEPTLQVLGCALDRHWQEFLCILWHLSLSLLLENSGLSLLSSGKTDLNHVMGKCPLQKVTCGQDKKGKTCVIPRHQMLDTGVETNN